jgi:hypothetical protein
MIMKALTSHISVQISEVVNSMKDLIDFSRDNSVGPIGMLLFFNIPIYAADEFGALSCF